MKSSKAMMAALFVVGSAAGLRCGCGSQLVAFPIECTVDSDCAGGQVCFDGICRKTCPCPAFDTCIDGLCFPAACGSDKCPPGLACYGNTCGDPPCQGK